jgi:hypothetical protein
LAQRELTPFERSYKTQPGGISYFKSILGLLKSLKIRALHSSTGKHVVPVWSLHLMVCRKEMHQLVEDNTLKKVYLFQIDGSLKRNTGKAK